MDHNLALLLQKKTKAEIFGMLDSAMAIAASRWPQDLLARRNLTPEKLFTATPSMETSDDDCVSTTSSLDSNCSPVPEKEADKKNDEVPAATSDNNKKARHIIRLKLPAAKAPDVASRKPDKNEEVRATTTSDNNNKKARHIIRLKLPAAKDQSKKPPVVVQETTVNIVQEDNMVQQPKPVCEDLCREVHQAKEARESALPVNIVQENKLVQQTPKSVDEDWFQQKLEASKRKLHESYQKIQESRKRIRVVDLADAPKPAADPKRSRIRYVR